MSGFNRPDQNKQQETVATSAQPETVAAAAVAYNEADASSILAALSNQAVSAVGAGTLADMLENFDDIIKSDITAAKVDFAHFPEAELALPGLAFYKKKGNEVRFFAIIAESLLYSKMAFQEEYIKTAGGTHKVEIDFPVSKCWNEDYIDIIKRALSSKLNVPTANIKPTHYYSVTKEQDIADKLFAQTAYNTARLAINESFSPSATVDYKLINNENVQVTVNTEITPGEVATFSDGVPLASDAIITTVLSAKDDKRNKANPHGTNRTLQLSKIAVKFDTVRVPVMQAALQQNMNYAAAPTPEYHKLLVITGSEGFDGQSRELAENPMSHILGVVSSGLLASGENWQSIFTTPAKPGSRRKSLGLLGYEYEPFRSTQFVPAEKKVEHTLHASSQDTITFQSLVNAYFVPNSMTLAIDIAKGGRSSWAQQLFLACARRMPGANDAIIAYLDRLTNGTFSGMWNAIDGDKNIFQAQTTTIHMGDYTTESQGTRDLREIDRLYLLDVTKENAASPESGVLRYTETFFPGATDDSEGLIRLHTRREDIKTLEPSARITGLADRLYLHPQFQSIVTAALATSGVKLNPQGMSDQGITNQLAAGFVPGQQVAYSAAQAVFRSAPSVNGQNTGFNHTAGPVYYG